jgi:nicotinate-nucleotide adenylyltransferase
LSSKPFIPVGVFGGTFDPIHCGHLRSALELSERLELAQLRLMPCATPPHRQSTDCTAPQRAAMVELAVAGESRLVCDTRELQRSGPSYTIDSLIELRQELGEQTSLSLIMGCDALLDIGSWHRWKEILDWAHVVVIARPGWQLPEHGPVAQWIEDNRLSAADGIKQRAAGGILIEELRPLTISSTEIRAMLGSGRSVRYLMPESVLDYIEQHRLYRKS